MRADVKQAKLLKLHGRTFDVISQLYLAANTRGFYTTVTCPFQVTFNGLTCFRRKKKGSLKFTLYNAPERFQK